MLGSAEFGDAIVVADLEAGIGTLTRLPEGSVDGVVTVVEPTPKSLEVGARAVALAHERALGRIVVIANRIRDDGDLTEVRARFADEDVVMVPDDPAIMVAERAGVAPLDTVPDAPAVQALVALAQRLLGAG